jgi:S-adenosylmethionine-diacylglycerol 3-amino-3-carboxypropyl transferase
VNPAKSLHPAAVEAGTAPAQWACELARRPVAFAQVREDALLDQWAIQQLKEGTEVLMVASGGCTVAALAGLSNVSRLHLVDINESQIALTRLKLRLLATSAPSERLALLGHASMSIVERRRRLSDELEAMGMSSEALGPSDLVATLGPDQAGRYEGLFSVLREALGEVVDELVALLQLRDPAEQARRADPKTRLGVVLDAAFDSVMALPNLIELFGERATRNRCEPFSRHFARRTREALSTSPAADNPYLWQMLLGRFPGDARYPWLAAPVPSRWPDISWTVCGMADALVETTQTFDFIHLSNILDWLAPEEARFVLEHAWKALRPGGFVLIRQLNSNLDLTAVGGRFQWLEGVADALRKQDRSFFYRRLYLATKP